tara:strand:- start:1443 stop:3224 length:1782 start_codon:yes stop_codon:yes gene_type:complete
MAEKPTAELVIKVDSDGVKLAGENLENLTKTGNKAEKALKNTGKSAGAIGGPFRAMRGSVQQASYQLQDIAVQAQMGTDAFIILGQQGPQLASIFGPGGAVLGVLIALGAVVGGTLFRALTGTGEAMKELAKDAKTLRDSFDDLGPAAQAYQRFLAAEEIIEGTKNLANLNAELKKGIKTYALGFLATVTNREADEKWTERKLLLNQQIERGTLLLSMKKEAVDGLTTGTEKLIEKLDEELITLGMTNIELAAYKATLAGATEAQIKQAASIQKGIDLKQQDIDKIKEQNKAKEKADKDAIKLEAKQKADAAKAAEEALKTGDKARILLEQVALENVSELEQLEAHLIMKGGLLLKYLNEGYYTLEEYLIADAELQKTYDQAEIDANKEKNDKKIADDRAYADAKNALDQMVLSSASGIVGQLAGLAEEGSGAQKALFLVQKGIAIATTIMNAHVAAGAALALPPIGLGPVLGLPYSNLILGMGYASAGIIAGTTIAGGRALGGQVSGGNSYLVGERGPELLTMGTSGRIATNENLKKAVNGDNSNSSNVINVNFSVQANDTAGFDRLLQSRRGQIVGMINQAVNNRGRSSIV